MNSRPRPSATDGPMRAFAAGLQRDGMVPAETVFTSLQAAGTTPDLADIGTADLTAGLFLPQGGPGVSGALTAGMEGMRALTLAPGQDEAWAVLCEKLRAADRARAAQGWTELVQLHGEVNGVPLAELGNLGTAARAAAQPAAFAAECRAGRRGALARLLFAADDPVRVAGDIEAVMRHAAPTDILFGMEGVQRPVQLLGPVWAGYAGTTPLDGEVSESPGGLAADLRATALAAATDLWRSFRNGVRGLVRWGRSTRA